MFGQYLKHQVFRYALAQKDIRLEVSEALMARAEQSRMHGVGTQDADRQALKIREAPDGIAVVVGGG